MWTWTRSPISQLYASLILGVVMILTRADLNTDIKFEAPQWSVIDNYSEDPTFIVDSTYGSTDIYFFTMHMS